VRPAFPTRLTKAPAGVPDHLVKQSRHQSQEPDGSAVGIDAEVSAFSLRFRLLFDK
jgi:hypothetical protein